MQDKRVGLVPIGCGHCMECKKQRATHWRTRLLEEVKHDKTGIFVTLTFSPAGMRELRGKVQELPGGTKLKGYALDNEIAKMGVKLFLDRYRKYSKDKKSAKHWLVTELGQTNTERIHLHGIIWTTEANLIDEKWQYGIVWRGKRKTRKEGNRVIEYFENYVNERTANYITKYIMKPDMLHPQYKSIVLCSPGIGRRYTESYNFTRHKFKGKKTKRSYVTSNGYEIGMPTYYRYKAWNDEEREALWLMMLDRKKRYVNGKEICIKEGEEMYELALKHAQKQNNEWNFGSPKHWNSKDYENQRRNLRTEIRISKNNDLD